MSDYKITSEEYEDAQNVVWDYEEQLKAEANDTNKDHEPSINYDGLLAAVVDDINEYRVLDDLHNTPCVDLMNREQKIRYAELYNKHQKFIDLFYGS